MISDWDWSTLVEAAFSSGRLEVVIGPISLIVALGVALFLASPAWTYRRLGRWRVTEITPTFFGTQWRIERNTQTAQLAHEAYVELVTRKAAIPFDQDNDVLAEVYDSWYSLFGEIRRLARSLDADEISSNEDLRMLHDLLIAVLNRGLRPHLTRWQYRFRGWFEDQERAQGEVDPQELQRAFPDYDELVESLGEANSLLIELSAQLKTIAHGTSGERIAS